MLMNSSSELFNLKNLEFKRQYELWKGNNRFFLNGLIYAGPNFHFGLLTLLYIILYTTNGILIVLLVINIIKKEITTISILFTIIQGFLGLITVLFCIMCIFSDPGVLPRNLFNMEIYNNCLLVIYILIRIPLVKNIIS